MLKSFGVRLVGPLTAVGVLVGRQVELNLPSVVAVVAVVVVAVVVVQVEAVVVALVALQAALVKEPLAVAEMGGQSVAEATMGCPCIAPVGPAVARHLAGLVAEQHIAVAVAVVVAGDIHPAGPALDTAGYIDCTLGCRLGTAARTPAAADYTQSERPGCKQSTLMLTELGTAAVAVVAVGLDTVAVVVAVVAVVVAVGYIEHILGLQAEWHVAGQAVVGYNTGIVVLAACIPHLAETGTTPETGLSLEQQQSPLALHCNPRSSADLRAA